MQWKIIIVAISILLVAQTVAAKKKKTRDGAGRTAARTPLIEPPPLEPEPEPCSMTITLSSREVQRVCQRQGPAPEAMISSMRNEFTQVKQENAELKAEVEQLRAEYGDMVDTVQQLKEETARWREIVEWPSYDQRFRPDNDTLITREEPSYKDCLDAWRQGNRKQGIYSLQPEGSRQPFFAYCDEEGWTVIQRRFDGSQNFNQDWQAYTAGFGQLSGEFWLGLENVHQLTLQADSELEFEGLGWNGKLYHSRHEDFYVAGEADDYELSIGNMTDGNTEDVMMRVNGYKFTAKDRDNDDWRNNNCAAYYRGGWWLHNCGSDPNRDWCDGRGCMVWADSPVKKTRFRIRPKGQGREDRGRGSDRAGRRG